MSGGGTCSERSETERHAILAAVAAAREGAGFRVDADRLAAADRAFHQFQLVTAGFQIGAGFGGDAGFDLEFAVMGEGTRGGGSRSFCSRNTW